MAESKRQVIEDRYFLPDGYRENRINITIDKDNSFYWDPERARRASLHQFAVYQWAAQLIRAGSINIIADVGCGFATKLAWLHDQFPMLEYWGIDQPHAVELCKQHYNFGQWLGVDFENSPALPLTRADLVISSDVIEHLECPDVLLDYYKRVAAPSGLILISTPERDILRGRQCLYSPNPYHVREWNRAELSAYLRSRGFEIIEHKVLPALRFDFGSFYLRKFLGRWMQGRSMRYNQAVLMRWTG